MKYIFSLEYFLANNKYAKKMEFIYADRNMVKLFFFLQNKINKINSGKIPPRSNTSELKNVNKNISQNKFVGKRERPFA